MDLKKVSDSMETDEQGKACSTSESEATASSSCVESTSLEDMTETEDDKLADGLAKGAEADGFSLSKKSKEEKRAKADGILKDQPEAISVIHRLCMKYNTGFLEKDLIEQVKSIEKNLFSCSLTQFACYLYTVQTKFYDFHQQKNEIDPGENKCEMISAQEVADFLHGDNEDEKQILLSAMQRLKYKIEQSENLTEEEARILDPREAKSSRESEPDGEYVQPRDLFPEEIKDLDNEEISDSHSSDDETPYLADGKLLEAKMKCYGFP